MKLSTRYLVLLCSVSACAALASACREPSPSGEPQAAAAPTPAAPPVDPKTLQSVQPEVTFDPDHPPPGYINCHRNHCHHVNGSVASYAQVMQAVGATKIVGAQAPKAMPSAPADVAAPPADAQRTPSGLASKVLKPGQGDRHPAVSNQVTVHYTGWTTDGQGFDSSVARGEPARFPLGRVIAGWTEGLQLMVVGEERRFWIPVELAYKGRPGKPAGMLVFDVELLAID